MNLKKLTTGLFTAVVLASAAQAVIINPILPTSGTINVTRWQGNENSTPTINAAIAPFIGSATELYKSNVGGVEEKLLAGSYNTVYANSAGDPEDALVTYVPGNAFIGATAYALLKDGNSTPGWYLFNLTALGWNGMEALNFQDFWVGNGAISHVSLYGTRRDFDSPGVPDSGSTIALLGLAVAALAFAKRKF